MRIAAVVVFMWTCMCALHALAGVQICEVAGPLALPHRKERPLIQTIDHLQSGTLRVEGRVWVERGTSLNDSKAAIVLVRFFRSDGQEVKPSGMPFSSSLKAHYRYLPTGEFKVQTVVPHGVTHARLEFLQWLGTNDLALSLGSLRCSLDRGMFGDLLEFVEKHFIVSAVLVILCLSALAVFCGHRELILLILALFMAFALISVLGRWRLGAFFALVSFLFGACSCWRKGTVRCDEEENGSHIQTVVVLTVALGLRLFVVCSLDSEPISDFGRFYSEIQSCAEGGLEPSKAYAMELLYGLLGMIFGVSAKMIGVVNAVLGTVQCYLSGRLAERIFRSRRCGLGAALMTAVNPIFVFYTPVVASEHLRGALVLLFLVVVGFIVDELKSAAPCQQRAVGMSATLAFIGMLAFATRGDSIGLFVTLPAVVVLVPELLKNSWRLLLPCAGAFVAVCLACAASLAGINMKTRGFPMVSCSDEPVFAFLSGTDLDSCGRWSSSGVEYLRRIHEREGCSGEFDFHELHLLKPYIMAEFRRRWRQDASAQIRLALFKHLNLWSSDGRWVVQWLNLSEKTHWLKQRGVRYFGTHLKVVKEWMSLLAFASIPFLFVRRRPNVLLVASFVFFLTIVLLHFAVEWQPRYSYVLWVFLPIWCVAPLCGVHVSCRGFRNTREPSK